MKSIDNTHVFLTQDGQMFSAIGGAFELTEEELLEVSGSGGVVAGAGKGAVIGAIGGVINAGMNGTSPIAGAFTGGIVGAVSGGLGALTS